MSRQGGRFPRTSSRTFAVYSCGISTKHLGAGLPASVNGRLCFAAVSERAACVLAQSRPVCTCSVFTYSQHVCSCAQATRAHITYSPCMRAFTCPCCVCTDTSVHAIHTCVYSHCADACSHCGHVTHTYISPWCKHTCLHIHTISAHVSVLDVSGPCPLCASPRTSRTKTSLYVITKQSSKISFPNSIHVFP